MQDIVSRSRERTIGNAAGLVLLALFAFIHLHRMGALSFTWDEGSDLVTVNCLKELRNPFVCTNDISQTRLPFYIHAVAGSLAAGTTPHFLVSFFFNLLTLGAVYAYTRREYGLRAATLFAALYVTSPAMLAAGRLVVTHSHIMVAAFSTLSFLALFESNRTGKRRWIVACAIASGLATACSVLAVFNGVVLLAFYQRRSWKDLVFFPIAAATFFAASIIYVTPENFRALIDACMHGGEYPFWNYLGLGTSRAPWFFPFLLLAIKAGPWLIPAFAASRRFTISMLIVLLLKGAVFGYETPHHQVQFYPLLYFFAAVGLARWWRRWIAVAFAALMAVQFFDVVRFFPNYLFFGSQYGDRFIGEFYGPAVIHGQGRQQVWAAIDAILVRDPTTKFLIQDNNALERGGPNYVPFTQRDPQVRYEYALVDRLYAKHFNYPERDAYNRFLAEHYTDYMTTWFPPHVWAYRLLRAR